MGEYTDRRLSDEIREVQREHLVEGAMPIRFMKNYYGDRDNRHVKYAIRKATGLPPSFLGYLQVNTKGQLMLSLPEVAEPFEVHSVRAAVTAALMHQGPM